MKNREPISDEKVLDLVLSGMSDRAIQREYGTCTKRVAKIKKANGVESVFEQVKKDYKLNNYEVSHGWVKTEEASVFIGKEDNSLTIEDVEKVCSELVNQDFKVEVPFVIPSLFAHRIVLSDRHIGMDCEAGNVFDYKYNAEVYKEKMSQALARCMRLDQVGEEFHFVDLGDSLDGYNGFTTRGGHELPQNMETVDAFELYVKTDIEFHQAMAKSGKAEKYRAFYVVNDNHSGSIGACAAVMIKSIIESSCPNYTVEVIRETFGQYEYGDHTFIITHGKDAKFMRRNWALYVNSVISNFAQDLIDHRKIDSKYIHIDKGDLHQLGYSRTNRFDYRSYMSFAPPSGWVQHNFGDTYSGFSIQKIPRDFEIESTDVYLNYK